MKIGSKIKELNEQQDAKIVELLSDGETYQRTAEVVGCSIGKVQWLAKKNGLLRRSQQDTNAMKATENTGHAELVCNEGSQLCQ
jgi:DNA invertase Pin-like site-specific DNA recombinase